jgi:hypothetical protein
MIREKPLVERNLGALKQRADRDRELLSAVGTEQEAGTCALALDANGVIDATTVGTNRPVRPADTLQMLAGCGFAVETFGGEVFHG